MAKIESLKAEHNAEIDGLREVVLGIQKDRDAERETQQAEIDNLRKEASVQPAPPIDRQAPDIEEINIRVLSPEAQSRANRGLRSQLKGASGLGVPGHDLDNLVSSDKAVRNTGQGQITARHGKNAWRAVCLEGNFQRQRRARNQSGNQSCSSDG